MGKFIKEKDYSFEIQRNAFRKEFICPCCKKSIPLNEAKLEKFELDRELVIRPKPGYLVRYGAYRLCPKCERRRDLTFMIPFRFLKIYVILAVITSIIACIIDFDHYGSVVVGFWLAAALPLWIIIWLIPNLIWWRASTFRKFDFDKCLEKNAIDWNPQFNPKEKIN